MEIKTLVFDKKEEQALRKLLQAMVIDVFKKHYNGRVAKIQEFNEQLERHKEEVKKEIEEYTTTCIERIRKTKKE